MAPVALLAAGGTGGHLFPAQALAGELGRRGWTIDLATDERADRYGQDFPARAMHILPAATITGRSPIALARTALTLTRGTVQAFRLIRRLRPAVVVGFGGYPTLPPLVAATLLRVPTVLHEANAVMGRANRFLARRVTAIATSFPEVRYLEAQADKTTMTGNPVRAPVLQAAGSAYPDFGPQDRFRLLVFGGSQGARVFSDIVPEATGHMDPDLRRRIDLTQQCRPEDMERVRAAYDGLGVTAELAPFFSDMADRIAATHLVVCRSGASTVAELAVIGRPAVLVPLPHAVDQDQKINAERLAAAEGGLVIDQSEFTPERLAGILTTLIADPDRLQMLAANAQSIGRADAASLLADLVEKTGGRQTPLPSKEHVA